MSATEIWAARRAKQAARGRQADQPAQLWATSNGRPPAGWEPIDLLCKTHSIDLHYRPTIGAQLNDRAIPAPMVAATPEAARKAVRTILASREARRV